MVDQQRVRGSARAWHSSCQLNKKQCFWCLRQLTRYSGRGQQRQLLEVCCAAACLHFTLLHAIRHGKEATAAKGAVALQQIFKGAVSRLPGLYVCSLQLKHVAAGGVVLVQAATR
jgi:hypothetical protein